MFEESSVFSSYSVDDLDAAERFYGELLGLKTKRGPMGILDLELPGGQRVMLYPKDDHQAATYTVLNFEVTDIEATVDDLTAAGVQMARYGADFKQDSKGISTDDRGPRMAWFTDPAGNIIAVMETGSPGS
ncbi:MAG TPA: VOC family protein [Vicinamibacterales bacterium]|nr:VOC family protein [Vicinamibacterales bacterium]